MRSLAAAALFLIGLTLMGLGLVSEVLHPVQGLSLSAFDRGILFVILAMVYAPRRVTD